MDTEVSAGGLTVKHRRSINLTAPFRPASFREHDGQQYETLKGLREWEVLGAKCSKCEHVSWLDKVAVERIVGDHYLLNLRHMLRCGCGNREGNKVLIGMLGRD